MDIDTYSTFINKLRDLLNSRSTTIVLVCLVVATLGFLGWEASQYYKTPTRSTSQQSDQLSFIVNNSIVNSLPYRTPFYSISYDRHGNEPVTISIFAKSPYYRYQALQYLLRKDPEVANRHTINFIDYKSPLESEEAL